MLQDVHIYSPIGKLKLKAREGILVELSFSDGAENVKPQREEPGILTQTVAQLSEYFEGRRRVFDLPLAPEGTGFQIEVWKSLRKIPYGQTITYCELSEQLGNPKAIRAVGAANGSNPIPIIIPCHRVVGSGQKLTGYSGGVEKKRWLLQHEGALLL